MQKKRSVSKTALVALEQLVESALATLLPRATIPIDGIAVKSGHLRAQLREHIAAVKDVNERRALLLEAVARERRLRRALAPRLAGARAHAAALYGEKSAEFRRFGFEPRKARHVNVHTKARAVAQRFLTRTANSIHVAEPTDSSTPTNGARSGRG
jgi:hypothetical protein